MTLSQEIDAMARDIAADLGRDWNDCGGYERESFRDEARREMCRWIVSDSNQDASRDGNPINPTGPAPKG